MIERSAFCVAVGLTFILAAVDARASIPNADLMTELKSLPDEAIRSVNPANSDQTAANLSNRQWLVRLHTSSPRCGTRVITPIASVMVKSQQPDQFQAFQSG